METCQRQYILLCGKCGAGHALWERQGHTARVRLRVTGLPQEPIRALLLSGQEAVTDLGLVAHGALCRELPCPAGSFHTLALVTDWPQARLVLWGFLQACPGRTLWRMQEVAARYLRYPAPGSAAAPLPLPDLPPKRPVFMLRPLTTGGKGLQ